MKKQNLKKGRLWALLLSIAMVMTMMPAMAFAGTAEETLKSDEINYSITKNCTLNLGGHTIQNLYIGMDGDQRYLDDKSNAKVCISGDGAVTSSLWVQAGAELTIEGGKYNNSSSGTRLRLYSNFNEPDIYTPYNTAKLILKGGLFISDKVSKQNSANGDYTDYTPAEKLSSYTADGFSVANINVAIGGKTYTKIIGQNPETKDDKVTGGTFLYIPTECVADGYEAVENSTTKTWTVREKAPAVAKIDTTEYATLAEAIAAVPVGTETATTITMIGNESIVGNVGVTIPSDKNITIDLNGNTISSEAPYKNNSFLLENKGILTIEDSTDTDCDGEECGKLYFKAYDPDDSAIPGYASNTIKNLGKLTICSGAVINDTEKGTACYSVDNYANGANPILTVTGGKIVNASGYTIRMYLDSKHDNKAEITGGTIKSLWVQDISAADKGTLNIRNATFKGNICIGYYDETEHFVTDIQNTTFEGVVRYELDSTNPGNIFTFKNNHCTPFLMDNPNTFLKDGTYEFVDEMEYGWVWVYDGDNIDELYPPDVWRIDREKKSPDSEYGGTWYWGYMKTGAQIDAVRECVADGYVLVPTKIGDAHYSDKTYKIIKKPVAKIGTTEYATLEAAFAAAESGDTIILLANTKLSKELEISKVVTLNMNGHDIDAVTYSIKIENGALNITGEGEISGEPTAQKLIYLKGSTDQNAENYSNLTVGEGVTLRTSTGAYGIMISQNNHCAYGVNIEVNGTVDTPYGIFVNGTINKTEGNVPNIVINGDVTEGIYAAGYANWTLNAIMKGEAPLSLKSGNIVINGGTYTATGEYKNPADGNNNGSEDTGAALSLTSNDSYAKNLDVTVNDGTFISTNGNAVYEGIAVKDGKPMATESYATISINGGKFKSASGKNVVDITTAKKKDVISGGYFSAEPNNDYVAPGKSVINTPTGSERAAGYIYTIGDVKDDSYTVQVSSEVGTLTGGGVYKKGVVAKITASLVDGYDFDGWYDGEKKISSSTEYSFAVNSDINLVAKYEANNVKKSLTPKENSGAITYSVNGGEKKELAKSENVQLGAKVEVSAAASEGEGETEKLFVGWYDGENNLLSKSYDYDFTMTADKIVNAKFMGTNVGEALVVFGTDIKDPSGEVISNTMLSAETYSTTVGSENYVGTASEKQPVVPSYVGYTFTGYTISITNEEGQTIVIDEQTQKVNEAALAEAISKSKLKYNVNLVANYEKSKETFKIRLHFKSGETEISKAIMLNTEYVLGDATDVWAQNTAFINGKDYYLTGYTYNDETFNGTDSLVIRPTSIPNGGIIDVFANYAEGTSPATKQLSINITGADWSYVNGAPKIDATMSYVVPSDCTVIDAGFKFSTTSTAAEQMTGLIKSGMTTNRGTYTLHLNVGEKTSTNVNFRAYVTYKDAGGTEHTEFSEYRTYSWNGLRGNIPE